MSKALVIKNVDFSTNKLDTVTFGNAVPCTAIALSDSTASMTVVGSTKTITATVTPSNTTDAVVWQSSNTNVVTVSGGVVTQVGVGSATITATCGTKSAECVITATNTLSFVYALAKYNKQAGDGQDYVWRQNGSAPYTAVYSSTQTEKRIKGTDGLYPILLGNGASTLKITVPSDIRPTVWFTNSTKACDYSIEHSDHAVYAKVISGDASAYDSSVPLGTRTVSIPSGADSVAISLQYPNNTITDEVMAGITIVAS